jgi:large subunit ribosomal protein L9
MRNSNMEVILREHVDNLGKRGEVVKVAAGYARNYLLPRKMALLVNDGNRKLIERERKIAEAREATERSTAEALASRIAQLELTISRRVGETEQLYGSVTSADLAEALSAHGLEVDRRKIQLAEPLKALGETIVPIRLHRDVTAQLKVKVAKQE